MSAVIFAHAFSATSLRSAIHEPPIGRDLRNRQIIRQRRRRDAAGRNKFHARVTERPAQAFNAFTPPKVSAGKNFKFFQPSSSARMTSVGVMTPGKSGNLFSCAVFETVSLKPGDTPNCAPAPIACLLVQKSAKFPRRRRFAERFCGSRDGIRRARRAKRDFDAHSIRQPAMLRPAARRHPACQSPRRR